MQTRSSGGRPVEDIAIDVLIGQSPGAEALPDDSSCDDTSRFRPGSVDCSLNDVAAPCAHADLSLPYFGCAVSTLLRLQPPPPAAGQ